MHPSQTQPGVIYNADELHFLHVPQLLVQFENHTHNLVFFI